eukprot:CAMPEP_0168623618 /NCGR_PEP_ID=MMETSP0449_2-20121227/8926_1 /TAXON_ID=1082188 /ORGANISM="Strombidium rassoulzadegani, Strain ras09" /LENGTH=222 /DNA_ID=CAMNT_0008665021 /DNA_START=962 /DNA_END=1629 /DNA_ORIENTATION=-
MVQVLENGDIFLNLNLIVQLKVEGKLVRTIFSTLRSKINILLSNSDLKIEVLKLKLHEVDVVKEDRIGEKKISEDDYDDEDDDPEEIEKNILKSTANLRFKTMEKLEIPAFSLASGDGKVSRALKNCMGFQMNNSSSQDKLLEGNSPDELLLRGDSSAEREVPCGQVTLLRLLQQSGGNSPSLPFFELRGASFPSSQPHLHPRLPTQNTQTESRGLDAEDKD